ncbi:hypothetical protein CEXT_212051 [Caerostris extrusa]|uniref:Uncharacterized protein n=1 Tax=Caerostris extrusa TaxID=172846 RepID=A0AAV4S6Q6_CAEEX|nr:hypothetical protein CEXT_212051 [Caerostris extrusa]
MLRYKIDSKVLRNFAFPVSEEIFRFGNLIIRTACHSEGGGIQNSTPPSGQHSIFVLFFYFAVRNFLIFLFSVQKNMRDVWVRKEKGLARGRDAYFGGGEGRDGRGFWG